MKPNTIWKYELKETDVQYIRMPINSVLLSVGVVDAKLCVWAEVNSQSKVFRDYRIEIYGTGSLFNNDSIFLGTVQHPPFVWHIYYNLEY